MNELEKMVYDAVQRAVRNSIEERVEKETSDVVKRLMDQHGIEYSALMHQALMIALENMKKESQ